MTITSFKKGLLLFFIVCSIVYTHAGFAQPVEQFIKVMVAPDHPDWKYATGEKVKFNITVLQNGNVIKNVGVKYEIGMEKMDRSVSQSANAGAATPPLKASTHARTTL